MMATITLNGQTYQLPGTGTPQGLMGSPPEDANAAQFGTEANRFAQFNPNPPPTPYQSPPGMAPPQGPQGPTGVDAVTGTFGLIPGYQGPGTPTSQSALDSLNQFYAGLAAQNKPSTPAVVDPYALAQSQGIDAINQAAGAETARINAHYDAQVGNLHQQYGSASAGVQQEGNNLYGDLNQLQQQGQAGDKIANAQIVATNKNAMAQETGANAQLAKYVTQHGGDGSAFARAAAANQSALGTNAASDQNFSDRLNQLQSQAMNNRLATAHVITTGSLNDLKSILNRSLADAGLQQGDALAKIAIQRIQDTATIHNQYAQVLAKATAKGASGPTLAQYNSLYSHFKNQDYTKNFASIVNPNSTTNVNGVRTPISNTLLAIGRQFQGQIAQQTFTPDQMVGVMNKYLTQGGATLSDPEKNMLRMSVGNAQNAYDQGQANLAQYKAGLVKAGLA